MIEIDDTQVWIFCFLPHINGMVITRSSGFIVVGQGKKPPKFVVKGVKTFNGDTYGVFGYGQTDLEAMQNAIDQAQKTEEEFATPNRP
jgi:hypothetical protein